MRNGSTVTKLITTFGRDERLQVMVPLSMRTERPDGMATYSHFRRFGVEETHEFMLAPLEPR